MSGPLASGAMSLLVLFFGLRWVLRPERVLARNPSMRDPPTVRRLGYVLTALGAAVLLASLIESLAE